ncbi:unnamed protein product [Ectocarpus sp. CCAP 1310/34]|nr:unnamed protein product [Ectocarpus sp. CCAP 1310/34]
MNARGKLVGDMGGPLGDDYMVEDEGHKGKRGATPYPAEELAVPLDTCHRWPPPSWPSLPVGAKVASLRDEPAPRKKLTTTGRQSTEPGWHNLSNALGKVQQFATYELSVPLGSWLVDPSAFESGNTGVLQLPAGMTLFETSSSYKWGQLVNGPSADGRYGVQSSTSGWKTTPLHGQELAVPLETLLYLHQVAALERRIDTLNTQLKEKYACNIKLMTEAMSMSTALEKEQSDLKKANDRIRKIAQGERLMLDAAGEHDYGSNLPSPADLVQRIESIQEQMFVDLIHHALGNDSNTWLVNQDAAEHIKIPREFVMQVLVETVHECYRRVHECVSRRTEHIKRLKKEIVGAAQPGRLAHEVELFERNALHEGYKEIFVEVCPESDSDQTELARKLFHELAECISVSKVSPRVPTALLDATMATYTDIVTTLLMLFLECEIQPSTTLKFLGNFGSREPWDPDKHNKESFDPSYEGDDKLVKESTQVQVVIPRLFWKKNDGDSITDYFETKASFVIRDT